MDVDAKNFLICVRIPENLLRICNHKSVELLFNTLLLTIIKLLTCIFIYTTRYVLNLVSESNYLVPEGVAYNQL